MEELKALEEQEKEFLKKEEELQKKEKVCTACVSVYLTTINTL